ncbi:hypothetical protein BHE74_00059801, partial [Ensete ventricosum]
MTTNATQPAACANRHCLTRPHPHPHRHGRAAASAAAIVALLIATSAWLSLVFSSPSLRLQYWSHVRFSASPLLP